MIDSARAKFDAALAECELHSAVLSEAASLLPTSFTAEQAKTIDSQQRRLLDQAAYRFMKLQDSLGEKVLPGLLELTLDPLPPQATFNEKLQRLERLGAVNSADTWRLLREVRNSLALEYSENPALQAAAVTRRVGGIAQLLTLWAGVRRFTAERLS
ncbi:MAG: hypothetical protein KGI35_00150 [Burkholderiales bacterium]|nr:hypothetical protein [Burkholderiales bacterium]MDE2397024.1 hypothetical protein [Burkholderiales bacterium]